MVLVLTVVVLVFPFLALAVNRVDARFHSRKLVSAASSSNLVALHENLAFCLVSCLFSVLFGKCYRPAGFHNAWRTDDREQLPRFQLLISCLLGLKFQSSHRILFERVFSCVLIRDFKLIFNNSAVNKRLENFVDWKN